MDSLFARSLLLVGLGLPGLVLMTYGGVALVEPYAVLGFGVQTVPRTWGAFMFLAGAGIALIGFQKLRRPLYSACFLPLPFIIAWALYLNDAGSWLSWIVHPSIILWPVLTYGWCENHYRTHGKSSRPEQAV